MAVIQYDIDNIRANPNARVAMILDGVPSGGLSADILRAYITGEEFSISLTANYEDAIQTSIGDVIGNKGVVGAGVKTAMDMAGFKTRTFQQTAAKWVGSERPTFNFNVIFVAVRENEDPIIPALKMQKWLLPYGPLNPSLGVNGTMNPPGNYAPLNPADSTQLSGYSGGFMTLSLGRWFRATDLILTGAEVAYSTTAIASGNPLFTKVAVSCQPFRDITHSEFENYFSVRTKGYWK